MELRSQRNSKGYELPGLSKSEKYARLLEYGIGLKLYDSGRAILSPMDKDNTMVPGPLLSTIC